MVHKFKANLNKVTKSKIELVAKYKQLQYKKHLQEAASSAVKAGETNIEAEEATTNKERRKIITVEGKEKLLREVGKRRRILEQEMAMIYTVRGSLLWLLQKATLLETQRNHA